VFGSAQIDLNTLEHWSNDNPLLIPHSPDGTAPAFVSEGLRDYLCARAIAAAIEQLADTDADTPRALQQWAMRFGHTPVTRGIVEELRPLMEQQDRKDLERWHPLLIQWFVRALTDPLSAPTEDPSQVETKQGIWAANTTETLLAAVNACARALKHKSVPKWPSLTAFQDWLACLQGQRRDMNAAYRMILSHLDFGPTDDVKDAPGADLSCLDLSGCDLSDCNLNGADLHLSDLTDTDLTDASLSDSDLSGVRMRNTLLTRATIRGANLSGVEIRGVSYEDIDADEGFRRLLPRPTPAPR
jgi:hypothetical protein